MANAVSEQVMAREERRDYTDEPEQSGLLVALNPVRYIVLLWLNTRVISNDPLLSSIFSKVFSR
jgi:hypothetical protein